MSNFDFIKKTLPSVYADCARAESYVFRSLVRFSERTPAIRSIPTSRTHSGKSWRSTYPVLRPGRTWRGSPPRQPPTSRSTRTMSPNDSTGGLGLFVRSLVALDRSAASEAFERYLGETDHQRRPSPLRKPDRRRAHRERDHGAQAPLRIAIHRSRPNWPQLLLP